MRRGDYQFWIDTINRFRDLLRIDEICEYCGHDCCPNFCKENPHPKEVECKNRVICRTYLCNSLESYISFCIAKLGKPLKDKFTSFFDSTLYLQDNYSEFLQESRYYEFDEITDLMPVDFEKEDCTEFDNCRLDSYRYIGKAEYSALRKIMFDPKNLGIIEKSSKSRFENIVKYFEEHAENKSAV
jgi:hypothetical protein